MTVRRIVFVYAMVSLLAVIAGVILEEIPLPPGGIPSSIVWIVLGPLVALFYAVRSWSLEWTAVVFYLIGSALLVPSVALVMQRRRIVRIIGYLATVFMWLVSGLLIFLAAWGA